MKGIVARVAHYCRGRAHLQELRRGTHRHRHRKNHPQNSEIAAPQDAASMSAAVVAVRIVTEDGRCNFRRLPRDFP